MNKWNISMPDKDKAAEMVKKSNLTMLCAEVLVSRGYNNLEAASEFIKFEDFRSPYEIKDMKEASEIILDAVDNNKYICIYGDYDCDGRRTGVPCVLSACDGYCWQNAGEVCR